MATTFSWNVTKMLCYPEADGKTDVVFLVSWNCIGVDGQYMGGVSNSCPVQLNPDEPYTPYANLTQQQVLGWVWASGVDKDATEAAVQQQIDNQINPPVVNPPLPWDAPTA